MPKRRGPFGKLNWGKLNGGKTKKTKRTLSNKFRTSLFSQLKQNISDSAIPVSKPTGPFKAIVLRVEGKCPSTWGGTHEHASGPAATSPTSFLNAWYGEVMGTEVPELIKVKARIPTLHASIPEPEKFGCDCSAGWHQFWIDMHPTFTASSQDIEEPECGDMIVVDVTDSASAGLAAGGGGGGGVIMSTVVTRENDGGLTKGGSCPPSDFFDSAESNAPLTASGAAGDAVGGATASNTTTSPIESDLDWSELSSRILGDEYEPPGIPGRNADGSLNFNASPYDKKGIFITSETLNSRSMSSPMAAVQKAVWANIGYVVIEACWQGPLKAGTASRPLMRKTNLTVLSDYVRAFRIAGINVYLWGHPWPGKASQFVSYLTTTASDLGAQGVVMFPGWGYLSAGRKSKYKRQAEYLTSQFMKEAHRLRLQAGFTNNWLPNATYTTGEIDGLEEAVRIKYKDSFPYACFTNVDWSIAQILSPDGATSLEYDESTGVVSIDSTAGENALSESYFVEMLEDYVTFGFTNIIPAFGALGYNYHDYGISSRKPPDRMQEELNFLAGPTSPTTVGETRTSADSPTYLPDGTFDTSHVDWDQGYFGKEYFEDDDETLKATIHRSVMWWDWLHAEEHTPCWQNSRWKIIREFSKFSPVAEDAREEGGSMLEGSTLGLTQKIQNTIAAAEAYNRLAARHPELRKAPVDQYTQKFLTSPRINAFGGLSSMEDIKSLGQAASSVSLSSGTELGTDSTGTGTSDPESTTEGYSPSTEDISDPGAFYGSDPTEEDDSLVDTVLDAACATQAALDAISFWDDDDTSCEMNSVMKEALSRYPPFPYINFDDPVSSNGPSEFGTPRTWYTTGLAAHTSTAESYGATGGFAPAHLYENASHSPMNGYEVTNGGRSPANLSHVVIHTTGGSGRNSAGGTVFQALSGYGSDGNQASIGATTYGINRGGFVWMFARETAKLNAQGVSRGTERSTQGGVKDKNNGVLNDTGVSIEIAGHPQNDANNPGSYYTDAMYEQLAMLVANICYRNQIPIDREHIFGHDELTTTRSDPGTILSDPWPDGIAYPWTGNSIDGKSSDSDRKSINSYSPEGSWTSVAAASSPTSTFEWGRFMGLIEGFFSGAGVPSPPPTTWPAGTTGGGGSGGAGSAAAAAGSSASKPPCDANSSSSPAGSTGAGGGSGTNPSTYSIAQVPDTSPSAAAEAGAYEVDENYTPGALGTIAGADRLTPAVIDDLPDGPDLSIDYVNISYYGQTVATKIILGKPVAVDFAPFFLALIKSAEHDGINLVLNSGWRTNSNIVAGGSGAGAWSSSSGQQTLYDANCSSGTCSPSTAAPGYSRHQKGVAFDINGCTAVGPIFEWMSKNGEAFGFYRTVKSERWHWIFDPTKNKYSSISADHSSWINS